MTDGVPRGAPIWARFAGGNGLERGSSARLAAWVTASNSAALPPPSGAVPECPLPFDWDTRLYAAVDVETTGLDPISDRVVEIAVLLFHFDAEGALVEERSFRSLVNPGIPMPQSAIAIHGISDFDLFDAPPFKEIAGEVQRYLHGRVFLAHNAQFDKSFLAQELLRAGAGFPDLDIADSLAILRLATPNLLSYSLGKAAFALGIDVGTSHRALDDSRTCMHLFARSARILAGACP